MSDLISRQAAIDALKICDNNEDGINCHKCPLRDERWDGAWQDNETNCYRKLMRDSAKLLELPSAQPRKGKWIYNSPVTMKCNQCGLVIKDWDWHRFKYCPNCYSDMRGGRE